MSSRGGFLCRAWRWDCCRGTFSDWRRCGALPKDGGRRCSGWPGSPLIACTREWDSARFYLARSDIAAFEIEDRDDLFTALRGHKEAWLLVRRRDGLPGLAAQWPDDLQVDWYPSDQGNVAVGLVR